MQGFQMAMRGQKLDRALRYAGEGPGSTMSSGTPCRRSRQGGFTLVEVLLAISLVALIMAMAYGGFQASVRATNSGEQVIEENNRLRVVHQFVRRQLTQAQGLVIEEMSDGERIMFEGERMRVRFVSPMPGYLSYGGPYVQQLSLEPGRDGYDLVYYYAMLNTYEPGDLDYSDGMVLLEGLDSGEFHFLGEDEPDGEPFWADYWDTPDQLPLAVALVIDVSERHRVGWPDMVAPVMIDRRTTPAPIERVPDMLFRLERGRRR